MPIISTWIVASGAHPEVLSRVAAALHDSNAEPAAVGRLHLRRRLREGPAPVVAILVGGVADPSLIEALRVLVLHGVPVLVLVESLDDRLEATLLGGGADDVVGLPASGERLRSRIMVLLRVADESRRHHQDLLVVGPLSVHLTRREVSVEGRPIRLTATEFDLLAILARDPNRVISRQDLSGAVWGQVRDRSLESHMSRIRNKVAAASGPRMIHAVRGRGYRL